MNGAPIVQPSGAAGTTQVLVPGARCARDANRAATGVCARCGDYLCGLCGVRVESRSYCAPCAERVASEHSKRAVHALVIGLLSVHGLFFLAPVAVGLAVAELAAIAAGEAPRGGRGISQAGLLLGLGGVAMAGSAALLLVLSWKA